MSALHTPGPWFLEDDDVMATVDGEPTIVADVFCGGYTRNGDDDGARKHANARLIAAAPDLVDELRGLYRAYVRLLESARDRIIDLGGDCDPVDRMEEGDPALCSARAAISKATGAA